MKLALSTSWNSIRLREEPGEVIVDEALELGFDALELGFSLYPEQVRGIKARLDEMPVNSVHAFCPVPFSAPEGHPELYQLVSPNEDDRAIAFVMIKKNIEFAASVGAKALVLHCGKVNTTSFWKSRTSNDFRNLIDSLIESGEATDSTVLQHKKYLKFLESANQMRTKRAKPLIDFFKQQFEKLIPILNANNVLLCLENLPYFEAFPNENEMESLIEQFSGAPLRAWFDTGHARVRANYAWSEHEIEVCARQLPYVAGCHINDVEFRYDDHFAAGFGNVDFKAMSQLASDSFLHVFEPKGGVTHDELKEGVALIRKLWKS